MFPEDYGYVFTASCYITFVVWSKNIQSNVMRCKSLTVQGIFLSDSIALVTELRSPQKDDAKLVIKLLKAYIY